MKRFVYADNAATTKLDIDAFEAMKPYLLDEYGNASQPYSFARKSRLALKEAREIIAQCINAEPEEIYFTSGGTESDNWAIKGVALHSSNQGAIVTSAFEHHAILNACRFVETIGYPVAYLYPNSSGYIGVQSLKDVITDSTQLVSIMMANNEIGVVQPIADLVEVAHQNGALFHTDAVQCVGHIKVDVKELCIDLLSASAHQFNGPKGIGFLYIKKGTKISPLHNGGSQEKGLRSGTENVASIVAMAVALRNNCARLADNTAHIMRLEEHLLDGLSRNGIPYQRNGSGQILPGLINVSFEGQDGETLLHRLDLFGIQVSTGSACDSVNEQISHVLKAISLDTHLATGTIRISLGRNNTIEDTGYIVDALSKIINT